IFMAYLILALILGLGPRRASVMLLGFLAFLVWVVLIPHPMARLVARDPYTLLIDFHSHSEVSHDGRPGFSAKANMRWDEAQGYNASFITDHNRIETSQKAKAISRANWKETGFRSLEGEEASLYKTHLVVLGNHERIDNRPYDGNSFKIGSFIHDMHEKH